MFRCCFRPEVENEVSILARRTTSPSNQPRSRVVPALAGAKPDSSLRGRQQSSLLLCTSNASASVGSQVQGVQASGSSNSVRLTGPWGNGSGKAAYKDPDQDRSLVKGLLGLLSRGGSADMVSSEASRSGRRKLAAAGGGVVRDDSSDNGGDDGSTAVEFTAQGGPGSRHGSKSVLLSHLKTAQPKRGILKKADTQLDAAAAGDEEALLRLANALASITDTTASTTASPATIKATASSRLRPSSASGGAASIFSSAAMAPVAVGAAPFLHNSSLNSSADIALDYLQASSCRNSGNAWLDAPAASVNAVGGSIGGAGALRVYPSSYSGGSSFQIALTATGCSGNQQSRLANSSTAMMTTQLGNGEETLGPSPAAAATPAVPPPVVPSAARVISVRSAAGGAVTGLGSSGWVSGPSVLYARDPSAVPVVAADCGKGLGRSGGGTLNPTTGKLTRATSVSLAQLQVQPQLDSLTEQIRRRLSEVPTSHIVPVAPPAAPPAGAGSDINPQTVRSHGSTPGAPPGDASVQSGACSNSAVKMTAFESISLPYQSAVACGSGGSSGNLNRSVRAGSITTAGSRRGGQLSAAARAEILRSLPQGKSPIWYAHKLREILGTADADGGNDACGDGSIAVGGGAVEDSDSFLDRSARLNSAAGSAGDASLGRRVSFARAEVGTGDGVSMSTNRAAAGDPVVVAAPTPRRLLSPGSGQQPAVSVRYLAGSAGSFRSGGPVLSARGQGPADAWTSAQQIALPGSIALPVQDPSPADSSVSGISAATLGGHSRPAVERSAGSASGVGSAAASAAAAAATALERLRWSGTMGMGSDKIQSEPLAKLRQLKMYEGMGKLYDPGTASKDVFGQPLGQQLAGAVPVPVGATTAASAAVPAPAFGTLGTSPSPSPVLVLETASRKLSDLLAALGTGGTVIHEEGEEDGE